MLVREESPDGIKNKLGTAHRETAQKKGNAFSGTEKLKRERKNAGTFGREAIGRHRHVPKFKKRTE